MTEEAPSNPAPLTEEDIRRIAREEAVNVYDSIAAIEDLMRQKAPAPPNRFLAQAKAYILSWLRKIQSHTQQNPT